MQRFAFALVLAMSTAAGSTAAEADKTAPVPEDRFLWLEDVTGEKSLDWARARNAESTKVLVTPEEVALEKRILDILDSKERIPDVNKLGPYYYNFWRDAKNPYDTPGLIYGEAKRPGGGTHGTLSKYCVHNTLVAAGPDIRAGFRNEMPTGNIDVVPTLLHLLGLQQPGGSDGRVLAEALAGSQAPVEKPVTQRREVTRTLSGGKTWKQYLQTTTYAGKTYFDEGNAAAE